MVKGMLRVNSSRGRPAGPPSFFLATCVVQTPPPASVGAGVYIPPPPFQPLQNGEEIHSKSLGGC